PDAGGFELKKQLKNADTTALLEESNYQTPLKNRLIADSQQLIRVDIETITPISLALEEQIIEQLEKLIPQVQVVAISDYGKGFLSNRLLQIAITLANKANIATIVDPKGTDFTKYKGAT